MIKKRLLYIVTEGETDLEFYKVILNTIKEVNNKTKFTFDKIFYDCANGIGKMSNKIVRKFKHKYCTEDFVDYEKVICLCFDKDVFEFSKIPPTDLKKLKIQFESIGVDKIILIETNRMIEDFFLYDLKGKKILKSTTKI